MQHKEKGERIILQLLRHPDTSPEQLQDAHRLTQNVEGMLREITTRLRVLFPPHKGYGLQYPWNNKDVDRYDEALRPKELT
jgi:hypothetical protein